MPIVILFALQKMNTLINAPRATENLQLQTTRILI